MCRGFSGTQLCLRHNFLWPRIEGLLFLCIYEFQVVLVWWDQQGCSIPTIFVVFSWVALEIFGFACCQIKKNHQLRACEVYVYSRSGNLLIADGLGGLEQNA